MNNETSKNHAGGAESRHRAELELLVDVRKKKKLTFSFFLFHLFSLTLLFCHCLLYDICNREHPVVGKWPPATPT